MSSAPIKIEHGIKSRSAPIKEIITFPNMAFAEAVNGSCLISFALHSQ